MVNIVKLLRTKLSLTLKDFAKVAGFTTLQQVNQLENGKAKIGFNRLSKIIENLRENGHDAQVTIIVHINGEDILLM